MHIETAPRTVITGGEIEKTAFKFLLTGKTMREFFSGIYANKPQSILRELCSNAYDAHVAAGCPERPFLVILPDSGYPHLCIRDYGTGMSHEFVMERFQTFGDSTKSKDNNQIGAKGLGSKSPLSYQDAYTVSCFDGAQRRDYQIYLDSEDMPTCSLIGTSESTEERGVEVLVPIHKKDFQTFAEAAKRVLWAFTVRPEGGVSDTIPSFAPLYSMNGWSLYNKEVAMFLTGGNQSSGFFARQGPVIYPIDLSIVFPSDGWGSKNRSYSSSRAQTIANNYTVIFDCEIGTLQVSTSRENLSYGSKEPTIGTIAAKYNSFVEEVGACLRNAIETAPSFKESYNLWNFLTGNTLYIYNDNHPFKSYVFDSVYNGISLSSFGVRFMSVKDSNDGKDFDYNSSYDHKLHLVADVFDIGYSKSRQTGMNVGSKKTVLDDFRRGKLFNSEHLSNLGKYIIVMHDLGLGKLRKIKALLDSVRMNPANANKTILLVQYSRKTAQSDLVRFVELFGDVVVDITDILETPPVFVDEKEVSVFKMNSNYSRRNSDGIYWNHLKNLPSEPYLYAERYKKTSNIVLRDNAVLGPDYCISAGRIGNILGVLNSIHKMDSNNPNVKVYKDILDEAYRRAANQNNDYAVYILEGDAVEEAKNDPNGVNILELLYDIGYKILTDSYFQTVFSNHNDISSFNHIIDEKYPSFNSALKSDIFLDRINTSPLFNLINKYSILAGDKEAYDFFTFVRSFDLNFSTAVSAKVAGDGAAPDTVDISESRFDVIKNDIDSVLRRYPLLSFNFRNYTVTSDFRNYTVTSKEFSQHLADYVIMCDKFGTSVENT